MELYQYSVGQETKWTSIVAFADEADVGFVFVAQEVNVYTPAWAAARGWWEARSRQVQALSPLGCPGSQGTGGQPEEKRIKDIKNTNAKKTKVTQVQADNLETTKQPWKNNNTMKRTNF